MKRAIQKTAEATGDFIGYKIADKITSVSKKKSANELPNNEAKKEDVQITTHKKRYISPKERQKNIDELRLVPKKIYNFRNSRRINVNVKKYTYLQKKYNELLMN